MKILPLASLRRTVCAASVPALLIALTPLAVRAQTDFDGDGDIIGVVADNVRIGFNNMNAITVFADAGTNVSNGLFVFNKATFDMSGGSIGEALVANDKSIVYLSGGNVAFTVIADGNSVVNVSGGNVGLGAFAFGNGILNISGGSINNSVFGFGDNAINISGGTINGQLVASNNTVVTLSGGNVSGELIGYSNSLYCLFGSGLSSSFVTFDGSFNIYSLSGFLADGTDITGKNLYLDNNGASFKLVNASVVPEPGVVAFVVIAAGSVLGLVARKRKK